MFFIKIFERVNDFSKNRVNNIIKYYYLHFTINITIITTRIAEKAASVIETILHVKVMGLDSCMVLSS